MVRKFLIAVPVALVIALILATGYSLQGIPAKLDPTALTECTPRFLDRNGRALTASYRDRLNCQDLVSLDQVPDSLQRYILFAEDKRFLEHSGVDWQARLSAVWQNLRNMRAVRGASTISEQVVKILHPRPRTLWTRWLEGFEAASLEKRFSKGEILSFYLNQLPYSRNRRGIVQGAREYFDRSLDTLSEGEMVALTVLIRAPGRLDPAANSFGLRQAVLRLSASLLSAELLSASDAAEISRQELVFRSPELGVNAPQFVNMLRTKLRARNLPSIGTVRTTLDGSLQRRLQRLLNTRLKRLSGRAVRNGAILVVDHQRDEILAWVNAGGTEQVIDGEKIDAILNPRQPGSTLKPFLYGASFEHGFTPATLVDDSPLIRPVGFGLHPYQNYSGQHYGPLRVRDVLGNSLNIPAIRMIEAVGQNTFLDQLRRLGFTSLKQGIDFYGEGLALGNGEVTLYELVRAYAALARQGRWRDVHALLEDNAPMEERTVFARETAAQLASILSDPDARALEFGRSSILSFPVQTAVKTGTSTDYRDAWTVGFSDRYTAGVWMGNLSGDPMREVTGAIGPSMVLRGVFRELRKRDSETAPLPSAPTLEKHRICKVSGMSPGSSCPTVDEYFKPGTAPSRPCPGHDSTLLRNIAHSTLSRARLAGPPSISTPSPGLQLASDPRIPDDLELFPLQLAEGSCDGVVEWFVDGASVGRSREIGGKLLWKLELGKHTAVAKVLCDAPSASATVETAEVHFRVK